MKLGSRINRSGAFKLDSSEKAEFNAKGIMLIGCKMGEEQALCSRLEEIPEIKNCLITYGSYDVVAEFETENHVEMNQVITSKIRKLGNVQSTITLRAIN